MIRKMHSARDSRPFGWLIRAACSAHTLPPTVLYAAHLKPFLHTQTARLNTHLAQKRAENQMLAGEVTAQRRDLVCQLTALERLVDDIRAASDLIATAAASTSNRAVSVDEAPQLDLPVQNLAQRVRDLEALITPSSS